jgi:hypothetical protein
MAIPARRRLIISDHIKALHHLKLAHKAMMCPLKPEDLHKVNENSIDYEEEADEIPQYPHIHMTDQKYSPLNLD